MHCKLTSCPKVILQPEAEVNACFLYFIKTTLRNYSCVTARSLINMSVKCVGLYLKSLWIWVTCRMTIRILVLSCLETLPERTLSGKGEC